MSHASLLKNDVLDRAVKTFIQAAVAQYVVTVGQVDQKNLLISAAAAGLSAVWSGVISPLIAARKVAKLAKFTAAVNAAVQAQAAAQTQVPDSHPVA